MKQFLARILSVLFILLSAISCNKVGGDDPGNDDGGRTVTKEGLSYTIKDGVKEMSRKEKSAVVDLPDEGTLVMSGSAEDLPKVGEIYVCMDKTDMMPNGCAGRVIAVNGQGGNTVLSLEPVSLDEIFTDYTQKETVDVAEMPFIGPDGIRVKGEMTTRSGDSETKAKDDLKMKVVPINFEKKFNDNLKFTFSGSFSVGGKAEIDVSLKDKYFMISPEIYAKLDLKYTMSGSIGVDFKETKVMIGQIPLATAGVASIMINVYGYIKMEGEIELSAGITVEFSNGFEWKIDHGTSTFTKLDTEQDENQSPVDKSFSLEGTFDFGIGIRSFVDICIFQWSILPGDNGFDPLYLDAYLGVKSSAKTPDDVELGEPLNLVKGVLFDVLDNAIARCSLTVGVYFNVEVDNWFTNKFLKDGKIKMSTSLADTFTIAEFYLYPSFDSWSRVVQPDSKSAVVSCKVDRKLMIPLPIGMVLREKGCTENIAVYERPEVYWWGLENDTVRAVFDNLSKTATYEVWPYASYFGGKVLSDTPYEFTLPADGDDIVLTDGPVDMGTGIRWMSCNLGASKPEEYGGYYAWGETETKQNYSWETYKYANGTAQSLTKYNSDKTYGEVDGKTVLEPSDDAATAALGNGYRIPTKEDWADLFDACTFKMTEYKDVPGYVVTSLSTGNSIFLPAAGMAYNNVHYNVGVGDYYWSSSVSEKNFASAADSRIFNWNRDEGLSIRPVYDSSTADVPALTLSTTSIDFGKVTIGTSKTQDFTVTNTGKADLIFSISSLNGPFSINILSSQTLASGQSKTFTVTYSPKSESSDGAFMTITSNATTNGTQSISLSGMGVKSSDITPGEAVDLGLSVKWATCNLGASKPEDYGGYYQWGGLQDVTDRSIYLDYSNCPYHTGSNWETGWTKYIPSNMSSYWSGSGSPDNKTVLDPEDDVAHVKLGGEWRMPTEAEFQELIDNCTSEWTTLNGVKGRKFTSKKNGNSIFLPAAGSRSGSDYLSSVGSLGSYCSSSLRTDRPSSAYGMSFSSGRVSTDDSSRYIGRSVRPVLE